MILIKIKIANRIKFTICVKVCKNAESAWKFKDVDGVQNLKHVWMVMSNNLIVKTGINLKIKNYFSLENWIFEDIN